MAATNRRFTIYDMMEARGDFEANPANRSSPAFAGSVRFPKMFYHPTGDQRKIDPGTVEVTPFGPQMRGEKWELVWQMAKTEAEEAELRAKGWHDHPAKALACRPGYEGPIPEISSAQHIEDLQRQLAETQALLVNAEAERVGIRASQGKAKAGPSAEL